MKNKFFRGFGKFREIFLAHRIAIILSIIILIGAYLRLSDFSNLARFNQDQVRDAQIVDAMIQGEEFPLLGPKAGGTTFKLGPAFYYLEYLSGAIFGFDPAGIAFFIPILATLSIGLLYLLLRNMFSANISLLLSFLYATSFYAIKYSRFAWNPNVIPFFLFAFLLLLLAILEKKRGIYPHILLGIVVGIGVQLHTTLLILMPLMLSATYIYVYTKERKIHWKAALTTVLLALALNAPFFIHDVRNNGTNMRAFFSGADSKTEQSASLPKKLLLDVQLFAQGTSYVLTGYEPQKNWTNPIKLIRSKSLPEICAAVFGFVILISGLLLLIKKIRNTKEGARKYPLLETLAIAGLSFLLFFPIAGELNIRFFIILLFLPFIFLGLIMEYALSLKKPKFISILVGLAIALIFTTNISAYSKTYDLDDYRAKDSAYGGISIGETREICDFIKTQLSANNASTAYLDTFEFERSVKYICAKENVKILPHSFKKTPQDSLVVMISNQNKSLQIKEELSADYRLLSESRSGRFAIFALYFERSEPIKIGFVTDIHGKKSKSAGGALYQTERRLLSNFIPRMNNIFKPKFVVQCGDLIEGTRRFGAKSIGDFSALLNSFAKLQMPLLHVIGNHELRGLSKDQWLSMTNNASSYYYKDFDGFRIIVLDGNENETIGLSDEEKYAYVISPKQLEWLAETLEETNARKLVFIHYPLFNPNKGAGDKILDSEQVPILHDLFAKNEVIGVFSGHTEQLVLVEKDGVRYFIIPGLDRSENKAVPWYESFAEITAQKEVSVDFYYKKTLGEEPYQTLHIPSSEFDAIEK